MVNNIRLVAWSPPPHPFPVGEARKIEGPIFDLAVVQQVVTGDVVFPITDKANRNLEDLEWDVEDVAKAIKSLLPTDYRNSEWCLARSGLKFDADSYAIPYDHVNERRKELGVRYYIKFGFQNNRLALVLLSCHV